MFLYGLFRGNKGDVNVAGLISVDLTASGHCGERRRHETS